MLMDLEKFPGYLGLTSQGVIALHADWPIYPAEHGRAVALGSLGQFPRGSVFRLIDDIDQCWLFVRETMSPHSGDPFDEANFHVALWQEDVHELLRCGYIVGAREITVERQRRRYEGRYWEAKPGHLVPVPVPTIDDYDDEHESLHLIVADTGIQLTAAGWLELQDGAFRQTDNFHALVYISALPIMRIGKFDAAVREACLHLEARLRTIVGQKNLSGQKLIEKFISQLNSSDKFISAYVKVLRGDLRTAFKFVRNDFMHELKMIGDAECFAILSRISDVQHRLDLYEAEL
jgi:hypothetical protein